ncbi:MAG: amidohydrolase family protein [Deltaproteobacteria bacterium]|nr:amidohydrolase family protein [Deltaproteobacteria bacterium]
MTVKDELDFSAVPVVDAHCHGFNREDITDADPSGWLDRLTLMGMCLGSSNTADKGLTRLLPEMTNSTLLTSAAKRWLASFFNCEPEAVPEKRQETLAEDCSAYIKQLLSDQNIVGLFVDDGYPQPRVAPEDFEALTGAPVHRVVRIEPLILSAIHNADNFIDCEKRYVELLEQAAKDPRTIAFKTIIAYRTGLDVANPSQEQVKKYYTEWKAANWREDRSVSKPVRDHLLHVAMGVANDVGIPFHIHTGGGDPDVLLRYARPSLLKPLLGRYMAQSIVLIHGGYPWMEETAFLASIFPRAYVELSVMTPWSTLYIDRALELFLGSVPANKIFHGSDEASEPELFWLAARQTKAALKRVLTRAVELDMLSMENAKKIGTGILSRNALELHGLSV